MAKPEAIDGALRIFEEQLHDLSIFMEGVAKWFSTHPRLRSGKLPIVHSVKMRLKDAGLLREKFARKWPDDDEITAPTMLANVTDLAGVRVLHLYQDQFPEVHSEILSKVNNLGDWYLHETPRAYSWDPESKKFFEGVGVDVEIKESSYTSVHYLVRPRKDSPLCCEIQVRTLFEEIWGEVDHALNYPLPTAHTACREQLRVLTKLVGAGSRLVDSIFRSEADVPHP